MKALVAAFNKEKALVGAFSVITNLRMELFQALMTTLTSTLQTEANAGEYDVPQCAPGTPAHLCVHEITAHFKVSDMMQVRKAK